MSDVEVCLILPWHTVCIQSFPTSLPPFLTHSIPRLELAVCGLLDIQALCHVFLFFSPDRVTFQVLLCLLLVVPNANLNPRLSRTSITNSVLVSASNHHVLLIAYTQEQFGNDGVKV